MHNAYAYMSLVWLTSTCTRLCIYICTQAFICSPSPVQTSDSTVLLTHAVTRYNISVRSLSHWHLRLTCPAIPPAVLSLDDTVLQYSEKSIVSTQQYKYAVCMHSCIEYLDHFLG